MKSYFFVPANRKEFLARIVSLNADKIIVDLEDAINNDQLGGSINNILESGIEKDVFIRIPFKDVSLSNLSKLVFNGFSNFVLPKVESVVDINHLLSYFNSLNMLSFKFIVLIENPLAIINLNSIVSVPEVVGLALGSHDYCMSMSMRHNLDNLLWARMEILNTAKAFNLISIDVASMELKNEGSFIGECTDGFDKGFEAKIIIHPWQLQLFNNMNLYTDKDLEIALEVKDYIKSIGGVDKFVIYRNQHIIIEKPHLLRLNKILEYYKHECF